MDALLVLLQELCQRSQPGIDLLFAAAGFLIEVDATAGAKTLTVVGTERCRVHVENERCSGQISQIYLVLVQHNNVLIFLVLLFLHQNAGVEHGLGIIELCCTPGADAAQRRICLKFTMQYTCPIHHTAVHNNRMDDRVHTAEVEIGQIHLKMEVLTGAGSMQDSVYVQTHSTPRNDTSSIIIN